MAFWDFKLPIHSINKLYIKRGTNGSARHNEAGFNHDAVLRGMSLGLSIP
jgi:hypothetical protein